MFTSPHLVNINERIRLNGAPISDEKFCEYFWQVWRLLEDSCTETQGMPAYFRFLTLMGFYVFVKEEVDAAVRQNLSKELQDAVAVVPRGTTGV